MQALWIALSGRYPMAFDEDFHFGLIKIYSNHLSPFWSAHLEGTEAYGAISRDPSYLYHLSLGFIYKIIKSITSDLYYQIIALRVLNIAMFASGLFVFRALIKKTNLSNQLVNYILLIFILVPVVPLLAAQINYDNLLFPVIGLALIAVLNLSSAIRSSKLELSQLLSFVALFLVASIIKYAFLPIALACFGFLLIFNRQYLKKYFRLDNFNKSLKSGSKITLASLVALNIVLGGLFIERYGLNLINYHKPVADCAEVLNYEKCQAYGPWIRDYNFEKSKPTSANTSVVKYMPEWVYGMWFRSFFSVDGPGTLNQTRGPLMLPAIISILFLAISPFAIAIAWKNVTNKYSKAAIYLFTSVILIYVLSLWLEEFRLFRKTAQPVAINGRYLILVMPLMFTLVAMSFNVLIKNAKYKYITSCVTALMLIWGGGAMTYVLRSNQDWYWPQSAFISHVSWTMQRTIGPVIPGYYQINFLQK